MEKQVLDKLVEIENEYLEIERKINDPNIFSNIEKLKLLNSLFKKYKPIYEEYNKYKSLTKDINDLHTIIKSETNKDSIDSYKKLLKENSEKEEEIYKNILNLLIEKDPNDEKNAIIEIKGRVGGEEANLFATNIFEMYKKYALKQDYDIEVIESNISEQGGFSSITFFVIGNDAYGKFKYESGTHRVQRVPKTESQDKLQTSTVSVYVIPENDDLNIEINPSDLRIDTYRSSGAGGQHVNKTDSAVRITHIPTGLFASSQDGRSQHDNKDKAMKALLSKINNLQLEEEREKESEIKRKILSSSERSEKIRTYNYPENRVTDHRINLKLKKLDQVLNGNLDEFVDALSKTYNNEI